MDRRTTQLSEPARLKPIDPDRTDVASRAPHPADRSSARVVVVAIVAIIAFLYLVRAILLPFVVAGALAFILQPLIDGLSRRLRWPRPLVASVIVVALILLICTLAAILAPPLLREIGETVTHLQASIERIGRWIVGGDDGRVLGQNINVADTARRLAEGLRDLVGQPDQIADLAALVFAGAFRLILTTVLLFYMTIDGRAIAAKLLWLVPPPHRPRAEAIWTRLDPLLKRYFIGMLIVVVYGTLAAYLGLGLVLRIPNALMLAVVTGLFETVPVVGPALSAGLVGLVALSGATSIAGVIGFAVYAIALRLSIDQVVSPLVLGRAARVHPVLIIFSFLVGGLLFNVVGIILAIPVALTIKTMLTVLYEEPARGSRG